MNRVFHEIHVNAKVAYTIILPFWFRSENIIFSEEKKRVAEETRNVHTQNQTIYKVLERLVIKLLIKQEE